MQGQVGTMLLRGAAVITFAILVALPLGAQEKPAASGAVKFPLEVAALYNSTRSQTIGSASFWMEGAGMQIEGRFYRGLGAVADVTGSHIAAIGSTGVGLDLVTATFGPRYTLMPGRGKYEIFGQTLVGTGIGFNSVFPGPAGASSTSYNLALKMGGGMNVGLSPHVALRAFEADWVRTELPNAANGIQNNLSLGAGIVFRIR